jgi:hypothetical protein
MHGIAATFGPVNSLTSLLSPGPEHSSQLFDGNCLAEAFI